MAFTDRYLKVPTKVYNQKDADLTGKPEYEDSFSHILPTDIQEYYESVDLELECTQLYLKNGRGFIVYLTVPQFEKLLNDHSLT